MLRCQRQDQLDEVTIQEREANLDAAPSRDDLLQLQRGGQSSGRQLAPVRALHLVLKRRLRRIRSGRREKLGGQVAPPRGQPCRKTPPTAEDGELATQVGGNQQPEQLARPHDLVAESQVASPNGLDREMNRSRRREILINPQGAPSGRRLRHSR